MADLIDREVLIEEFKKLRFPCLLPSGAEYLDGVMTAVHKYSSVVSEAPAADRWIPCSEMFPEDDEPVLITCNSYHVHKAWYDDITHRFNISDSVYWYLEDEVLAWMPLPEAYRPSKSEV